VQATTCERKVRVYDLESDTESYIPESETLVSMSLSREGRHLLVNLTSQQQHLWDLGPDPRVLQLPAMPCASYQGPHVRARGGCCCMACVCVFSCSVALVRALPAVIRRLQHIC
jgi:hypothetical protein